jgi:H+/Cl- antiporter ClcA
MLTPSLSIGALLAIVLGSLWSTVWPGTPLGAFAIIAAAGFLAAAMNMPLAAIALVVEFTWIDHEVVLLLVFAVIGAVGTNRRCARAWPHAVDSQGRHHFRIVVLDRARPGSPPARSGTTERPP